MGCTTSNEDSDGVTIPINTNINNNNNNNNNNTPQRSQEYNHLFKLLLIGDSSVGKTSICTRFTDCLFTETFISTLGVDFKIRTLTIDDQRIRLQVWDTAGQQRFRTITQAFYRGAHGVVIVYDITSRDSFLSIARWLDDTRNYAPDNALKILVGNKSDLLDERQVTEKEGSDFSKQHHMIFVETSAKLNNNIEELFHQAAKVLLDTKAS